jgi:hypothetical protein
MANSISVWWRRLIGRGNVLGLLITLEILCGAVSVRHWRPIRRFAFPSHRRIMRGIWMRTVLHRWSPMVLALAAILCGGPALAQVPHKEQRQADALEKLARDEFGDLNAAERILVRGAASRDVRWVGPNDNPDDPANDPAKSDRWGSERSIRAGLFAWLVADPEAAPLLHPSGPGIAGAKIVGKIDLSYADVTRPLTLIRCAIPDGIDLSNASLADIELRSSVAGPITADFANIKGDLALHFGHYGALSLFRATIGGDFDCSGADFTGSGVAAPISAQESSIGGDASFVQNFSIDGTLYFRLARIGRSLSFNHARFVGSAENGLDAQRATITGPFYWVDITLTPQTKLDLENVSIGSLFDNRGSWPAAGNLDIDGFTYSDFGNDSPADADERLQWLALQAPGYRPQPYMQLANTLKQGGRGEGEIEVLIAQRIALRQSGHLSFASRVWNLLLEGTIAYGYRPMRALWWIAGFVLVGALLFGWGYHIGVMTPSESDAYEVFVREGRPPVHYTHFNAFVYSLENFLPVVDLHLGNQWHPNVRERVVVDSSTGEWRTASAMRAGKLLRWYLWFHILAGWILTPLLFAGLSGLIRVE